MPRSSLHHARHSVQTGRQPLTIVQAPLASQIPFVVQPPRSPKSVTIPILNRNDLSYADHPKKTKSLFAPPSSLASSRIPPPQHVPGPRALAGFCFLYHHTGCAISLFLACSSCSRAEIVRLPLVPGRLGESGSPSCCVQVSGGLDGRNGVMASMMLDLRPLTSGWGADETTCQ